MPSAFTPVPVLEFWAAGEVDAHGGGFQKDGLAVGQIPLPGDLGQRHRHLRGVKERLGLWENNSTNQCRDSILKQAAPHTWRPSWSTSSASFLVLSSFSLIRMSDARNLCSRCAASISSSSWCAAGRRGKGYESWARTGSELPH